jgi:hypothetical protein
MNNRPEPRDCFRTPVLVTFLGLALTVTCAARGPQPAATQSGVPGQTQPRPLPSPQNPQNPPEQPDMTPPALTPKQQRELLKSRYEKLKQEATQLADLAKSLQQDLDKSNSDVLSLGVVDKADKIEKLAKKIKSEAVQ